METERKEFETAMWTYYLDLKAKGWSAPGEGDQTPEALFWREESGKYGVLSVEAAWNGWQMARKSVVPVAQLSELPKLAFDESHIDYIDRYGGFCRDCADEDGVCPSSGLPCGGSKKAIRHVLTALAYGVNHGYIPVILCAAPTTPKDSE